MPFIPTRAAMKLVAEYKKECAEAGLPCWLCGQPINYDAHSGDPDYFNVDHAIPTSIDPDLELDVENFRPSHASCNKSRGNKPPVFALGAPSEAW